MAHTATVRTVKVSETDETYDPYTTLVAAILARAVADAQGEVFAPGAEAPGQLQQVARVWLAAETGPRALVELAGFESAPVLQRVRQLLQAPVPVDAAAQLVLFAND